MKFPYYNENDLKLYDILPKLSLYQGEDPFAVRTLPGAETYPVWMPDGEYSFLHEAAVIAYHGKLFASWYNNPAHELNGRTPIRARKSLDGGKTWDQVVVIADDPTGEILYCPPVYGIVGDTLYLILNEMVAPDHIHAWTFISTTRRPTSLNSCGPDPFPSSSIPTWYTWGMAS